MIELRASCSVLCAASRVRGAVLPDRAFDRFSPDRGQLDCEGGGIVRARFAGGGAPALLRGGAVLLLRGGRFAPGLFLPAALLRLLLPAAPVL